MIIDIPDTIDLSRSERYVLTIFLHPEKWSVMIHEPGGSNVFVAEDQPEQQLDVFASFKDWFFENDFFACPFQRVVVVSLSNDFTFIPEEFEPNMRGPEFLQYLSSERGGVIEHNIVAEAKLFVVYRMTEAVYDFFFHSFPEPVFVHQMAPLIGFFSRQNLFEDRKRMVVCSHGSQLDLLCFDGEQLLLANSYSAARLRDALYYIMFTWKQLKYSQTDDVMLVDGDADGTLTAELSKYIRYIYPATEHPIIPLHPGTPVSLALMSL